VRRESELAARPEFIVETYKAALRADVSVTPPRIEQAIAATKGLEAAVAEGGTNRPDQLPHIYASLAKSLNEQLQQMRDAGRKNDVIRLSRSLS